MNRTLIKHFGGGNGKVSVPEPNKKTENLSESEASLAVDDIGCFTSFKNRTFRKKILFRTIPILNWLPKYDFKEKFVADMIAGVTIALTLLPQGLAYANVAGVPPQYGLYSAFVGCFVYIFLGGTKSVTIGPTAIMSIIAYEYGHKYPPEYYILLTFFTGVVALLMGIFQLGFIVNFISTPVLSAFSSASALTIVSTQFKLLFGLNFPSDGFINDIKGTFEKTDEFQLHDSMLSLVSIIILLFLQSLNFFREKLPSDYVITSKIMWFLATSRSAILIVLATLVYTLRGDPPGVEIVGKVEEGLPPIKFPEFEFSGNNTDGEWTHVTFKDFVSEDFSAILVIPLLAMIEHVTIAKVTTCGAEKVNASQELLAIGVSNLLGSFFGSIPITGSFSRTLVNHSSGAQSPLGGLITGVLVILSLQFLTPQFEYIPKAALASVIVCAVIFSIDFKVIFTMWKSKKMDIIPWLGTFVVSLALGLQFGIMTGFGISLIYLCYYSAMPGIRVERAFTTRRVEFILVEMDRSLVFPAVEFIRYVVNKSGTVFANNKLPVVINCQHIQFADFTAAKGMHEMFHLFQDRHQEIILLNIKDSILRTLSGVRERNAPEIKHCKSERALEDLLHSIMRMDKLDQMKDRVRMRKSRVSVMMEM